MTNAHRNLIYSESLNVPGIDLKSIESMFVCLIDSICTIDSGLLYV